VQNRITAVISKAEVVGGQFSVVSVNIAEKKEQLLERRTSRYVALRWYRAAVHDDRCPRYYLFFASGANAMVLENAGTFSPKTLFRINKSRFLVRW
jgi:hypothetical protein